LAGPLFWGFVGVKELLLTLLLLNLNPVVLPGKQGFSGLLYEN
jgi:hypothetical protein